MRVIVLSQKSDEMTSNTETAMEEQEKGDGGVSGWEGDGLNLSTWLVIQSDYHCLTAPSSRLPPTPRASVSYAS